MRAPGLDDRHDALALGQLVEVHLHAVCGDVLLDVHGNVQFADAKHS
jgi:hypothetical protein